jgi:hypothetical protein
MIQSLPDHNLGDQQMTYRMAANAIWNKLNFALSLVGKPEHEKQLWAMMCEARAVASSIVMDEQSGDMPNAPVTRGTPSRPAAGSQGGKHDT